jgi:hypothetical protein
MGMLMIILPRRYAFIPLIFVSFFFTMVQQFVIATAHFPMLRVIIFFGFVRIIVRKDFQNIKINRVDKLIIWWIVASVITYTISYGTDDAFKNRLGLAYNAMGLYFFFRFTIRDFEDVKIIIKTLAILVIPLALFMLAERTTGRNIFSVFGGVPEFTIREEGRLRCIGPFGHPILAGTLGAWLVPLFIGYWFYAKKSRPLIVVGSVSATIITIISGSSGPLFAYVAGIVGLLMWYLRQHMRAVVFGVIALLILLHLIMKAPVWYLLDRAAAIAGGGGWHRAAIIDAAITHFNEWWLVGTTYTRHWMPNFLPMEPNMADITNQYVRVAVDGGLITLVLFIVFIVFSFKSVGDIIRSGEDIPLEIKLCAWSLGAALFIHTVSFISVSYFDQTVVFWFLTLGMISALGDFTRRFKEPDNLTAAGI